MHFFPLEAGFMPCALLPAISSNIHFPLIISVNYVSFRLAWCSGYSWRKLSGIRVIKILPWRKIMKSEYYWNTYNCFSLDSGFVSRSTFCFERFTLLPFSFSGSPTCINIRKRASSSPAFTVTNVLTIDMVSNSTVSFDKMKNFVRLESGFVLLGNSFGTVCALLAFNLRNKVHSRSAAQIGPCMCWLRQK